MEGLSQSTSRAFVEERVALMRSGWRGVLRYREYASRSKGPPTREPGYAWARYCQSCVMVDSRHISRRLEHTNGMQGSTSPLYSARSSGFEW